MVRFVALAVLLLPLPAIAQTASRQPSPSALSPPSHQPPQSHQVNPDGSITFRVIAPAAKKVVIALDLSPKPMAATRDSDGLWSVSTPPLAPEFYGYDIVIDGLTQLDPLNPDVRFNYVYLANQVLVPGTPPAPWELTAIPHGRVDRLVVTTHVQKNLPADQTGYVVYTPPGYNPQRKPGYPTLYLLHGWSDRETAWTEIGRANLILDALIAQGKAVPMIVVMPLGYGNLDFVQHGFSVWSDQARVEENTALFSKSLLTEVMPAVEQSYDTAPGRENRAIAGLSMGGLESLTVGLTNPDRFAWVAGMSAAVFHRHFDETIPAMAAVDAGKQANFRLLWVACGVTDPLIQPNRDFITWARAKGLTVTPVETPLGHIWLTWRDNLVTLAPLLFQPK